MDPLSIAVSCVTLVEALGKLSVTISAFVRDVRSARKDLDAVSREVLSLRTVLELLEEDTSGDNVHSLSDTLRGQIIGMISNCNTVAVEIEIVLNKHNGNRLDKAARWAMSGKSDVNKLKLSLEAHKSALEIALDMVTLTITRRIESNTQALLSTTDAIKLDTATILDEIARLRAQLPADVQATQTNIILDRYLNGLTSYAESVSANEITRDEEHDLANHPPGRPLSPIDPESDEWEQEGAEQTRSPADFVPSGNLASNITRRQETGTQRSAAELPPETRSGAFTSDQPSHTLPERLISRAAGKSEYNVQEEDLGVLPNSGHNLSTQDQSDNSKELEDGKGSPNMVGYSTSTDVTLTINSNGTIWKTDMPVTEELRVGLSSKHQQPCFTTKRVTSFAGFPLNLVRSGWAPRRNMATEILVTLNTFNMEPFTFSDSLTNSLGNLLHDLRTSLFESSALKARCGGSSWKGVVVCILMHWSEERSVPWLREMGISCATANIPGQVEGAAFIEYTTTFGMAVERQTLIGREFASPPLIVSECAPVETILCLSRDICGGFDCRELFKGMSQILDAPFHFEWNPGMQGAMRRVWETENVTRKDWHRSALVRDAQRRGEMMRERHV